MKIDISNYKEEDITNISKEETPIVKALNRQASGYYIATIIAAILIAADAYMHEEIGRVVSTVAAVILAIIFIYCLVQSVRIKRQVDKIKTWQVNELYRRIREKGEE